MNRYELYVNYYGVILLTATLLSISLMRGCLGLISRVFFWFA